MKWPIRNQIFLPFAALLAFAIGLIAVTSSYLAGERFRQVQSIQLSRVLQTLGTSDFPYTNAVLQKMRALSAADFVVLNSEQEVLSATIETSAASLNKANIPSLDRFNQQLVEFVEVDLGEETYRAASLPLDGRLAGQTLYVLYPQSEFQQAQWAAMWPPLAIGAATLILMLVASAWLSSRFGRRIADVEAMFSKLASGSFPNSDVPALDDELRALIVSSNELSKRLEELQSQVKQTERLRLLGQLAGGFAHQLRNAVTGARLAVELHARQCSVESDENLRVAQMQLSLTEKQIQGLLQLGRQDSMTRKPARVEDLFNRLKSLLSPQAEHHSLTLKLNTGGVAQWIIADSEAMEATLLNLGLNGMEAAGNGGQVVIEATQEANSLIVEVRDDGSGLADEIADKLFSPFESTKPEGVGIGLTLAQQTAHSLGGTISVQRDNDWTVFRISIPNCSATETASLSG